MRQEKQKTEGEGEKKKRSAVTNTAFNIVTQNWLLCRLPVTVRSSVLCPKGRQEETKALRSDVIRLMGSVLFWFATFWTSVFEQLNNDKILISIGGYHGSVQCNLHLGKQISISLRPKTWLSSKYEVLKINWYCRVIALCLHYRYESFNINKMFLTFWQKWKRSELVQ